MKSLVFKAKGSYARFRKSYTTTSALTYLLIHPIAVRGLIGAVLGIDKNDLYEETKDIEVAIQVINEVRKDMQSFNLLNMKSNDKIFRFPSNVEFLRDVEYRIFIKCNDEKLNKIKDTLISGEFIFTPYLGASEHVAKIEYENTYDIEPIEDDCLVDSAVDINYCEIDFEYDNLILSTDNIPVKNNKQREYTEYKKVIFATKNKRIKVISNKCNKVGKYNVMFI